MAETIVHCRKCSWLVGDVGQDLCTVCGVAQMRANRSRGWLTWEECEKRWPRLVRSMQWAAILSSGEAACALRDYRSIRDGHLRGIAYQHMGGEAVVHFGGCRKVILSGIEWRESRRNGGGG